MEEIPIGRGKHCPLCGNDDYGSHYSHCPKFGNNKDSTRPTLHPALSTPLPESGDTSERIGNFIERNDEPDRSRLTVLFKVYYQRPRRTKVEGVSIGYDSLLNSNKQIYQRELEADEDWELIDTGWVEKASMIVVENVGEAPLYLHLQPLSPVPAPYPITSPQKVARGVLSPSLVIHRTACQPLCVTERVMVFIRSDTGIVPYNLTVIPD